MLNLEQQAATQIHIKYFNLRRGAELTEKDYSDIGPFKGAPWSLVCLSVGTILLASLLKKSDTNVCTDLFQH